MNGLPHSFRRARCKSIDPQLAAVLHCKIFFIFSGWKMIDKSKFLGSAAKEKDSHRLYRFCRVLGVPCKVFDKRRWWGPQLHNVPRPVKAFNPAGPSCHQGPTGWWTSYVCLAGSSLPGSAGVCWCPYIPRKQSSLVCETGVTHVYPKDGILPRSGKFSLPRESLHLGCGLDTWMCIWVQQLPWSPFWPKFQHQK